MKRFRPIRALLPLLILALTLSAFSGCGTKVEPAPQPTDASSPAPTQTAAPSATPASTPEPSATAVPTAEPAPEPTPEPTELPGQDGDSGEKPIPEPIVNEDGSITVFNVEQLVAVIAPGQDVVLAQGVYNIYDYFVFSDAEPNGEYWYYSWGTLTLIGLTDFTIRAMEDNTAELVTEDAYADVLKLSGCENIGLYGLTMGHAVEPGRCSGGVLELTDCRDIRMQGLDLYGCGTYGLIADHTIGITAESCILRECSYGIMNLYTCSDVEFRHCTMQDCYGYEQLALHYTAADFIECNFTGNYSEYGLFSVNDTNSITFSGCEFDDWALDQIGEATSSLKCIVITDDETPHGYRELSVHSAEELIEAIQPNTLIHIILDEPMDLTAYLREVWESEGEAWNDAHSYVQIEDCYDGLELVIRDIDGLSLVGSFGKDRSGHIYVEPRYADVFRFENCSHVSLRGLTLGHTETGECFGNVLSFASCYSILLDNLDVYGCGYFGLAFLNGCRDAYMNRCLIRDCSAGPVYIENSSGSFSFMNCELTGSAGGGGYWGPDDLEVYFFRCRFGLKESEALLYHDDIRTEFCEWDPDASWYPDYEWNESEMDPTKAKVVPFDEDVLMNTYWIGWQYTDTNTEITRYLPFEDANGNTTQFCLTFSEDGTGLLEGYSWKDISFTWDCDSDYTALLDLDGLENQGSVSLHFQQFDDDEGSVMWLMLYLDGIQIWFF